MCHMMQPLQWFKRRKNVFWCNMIVSEVTKVSNRGTTSNRFRECVPKLGVFRKKEIGTD